MLLKYSSQNRTNNIKLSVYDYKKSIFIKKGVVSKPNNVKGQKSLRSRKNTKFRKYFICNHSNKERSLFLVKNIFFSKKFLKFYMNLVNSKKVNFLTQTLEGVSLFGYVGNSLNPTLQKYEIKQTSYLGMIKRKVMLSNVELFFGKGAQYARAAGSFAWKISVSVFKGKVLLQLPSKEIKYVSVYSQCLVGRNFFKEKSIYKKGNWRLKRMRGFGPVVRGIAMNPVDHPHGGNKKSVRFPRTPWGKAAKIK